MEYPTVEEIDKAFSQEGLVGNLYKNYEPRAEQRDMSTSVRDAFASGDNLVVEAGTGVGKSMAYLGSFSAYCAEERHHRRRGNQNECFARSAGIQRGSRAWRRHYAYPIPMQSL